MKKILKHLRKNWIRHGFETLVVIVGVLIAFTLNDSNEQRKDRKVELKLLFQLSKDLEETGKEIKGLQDAMHGVLTSITVLLNCAESQDSCDLIKGNPRILYTVGTGIFNSTNTTFKFIESEGMSSLSNDSLRIEISYLYDKVLRNIHEREDLTESRFSNDMIRLGNKYFEFKSIDLRESQKTPFDFEVRREERLNSNTVVLIDEEGFKNDIEFKNTLYRLRNWHQNRSTLFEGGYAEIQSVITSIQDEIERLEN